MKGPKTHAYIIIAKEAFVKYISIKKYQLLHREICINLPGFHFYTPQSGKLGNSYEPKSVQMQPVDNGQSGIHGGIGQIMEQDHIPVLYLADHGRFHCCCIMHRPIPGVDGP